MISSPAAEASPDASHTIGFTTPSKKQRPEAWSPAKDKLDGLWPNQVTEMLQPPSDAASSSTTGNTFDLNYPAQFNAGIDRYMNDNRLDEGGQLMGLACTLLYKLLQQTGTPPSMPGASLEALAAASPLGQVLGSPPALADRVVKAAYSKVHAQFSKLAGPTTFPDFISCPELSDLHVSPAETTQAVGQLQSAIEQRIAAHTGTSSSATGSSATADKPTPPMAAVAAVLTLADVAHGAGTDVQHKNLGTLLKNVRNSFSSVVKQQLTGTDSALSFLKISSAGIATPEDALRTNWTRACIRASALLTLAQADHQHAKDGKWQELQQDQGIANLPDIWEAPDAADDESVQHANARAAESVIVNKLAHLNKHAGAAGADGAQDGWAAATTTAKSYVLFIAFTRPDTTEFSLLRAAKTAQSCALGRQIWHTARYIEYLKAQ